jgi:drug/metabolite transporter (DMT)-like permease
MARRRCATNRALSGSLIALAAAVLYGASFPFTKQAQNAGGGGHAILASLLYLPHGLVFFAARVVRPAPIERRLRGRDWLWLGALALCGGVLAPLLYVFGQRHIPAYQAALLSPTEILFTSLLAVLLFGERLTRREIFFMALIVVGATAVGYDPKQRDVSVWAVAAVVGSYLLWGIDNNCTARIAERDPLQIAAYKGLAGGTCNLGFGLALGDSFPTDPSVLLPAVGVGLVCYGGSYALIILSMRSLGAAKSMALLATNPAFAVLLSWLVLSEVPAAWKLAAGALMAAGVAGLMRSAQSANLPPHS